MLENYVKWFCNWIDKPYKNRYTLDIWVIKVNRNCIVRNIEMINYKKSSESQLTIFDYDIA